MTARSFITTLFRKNLRLPLKREPFRKRKKFQKDNSRTIEEADVTIFKQALDSLMEGVIITDAHQDHGIVYINQQFLSEIGYDREEVIGKNPRFLQGPKSDPSVVRKVRECIKKNEPFRGEIINYRKDGSYFHNLMTITPIMDHAGKTTHFIGLQSNINYRDDMEKEIRKTNELFNLAVQATKDVIWDWDLAGNRKQCQSSLENILGYGSDQISTDPEWFFSRIHEGDREQVYNTLDQCLKARKAFWEDEYRFLAQDGNYRYILDRAYIVYDTEHRPVRMIGAMQDLTNHKKLLDAQINLTNELSHSNKDLQQFGYIVSHNLGGSVASIKGLANVLELHYSKVPEETRVILTYLAKMAENLDNTIKDLVEILRIRTEFNELKEEIRFSEIVDQVQLTLQDQINSSKAEIRLDFSNAPSVRSLKSYVFSIIYNLLSNAIKYRSAKRSPQIMVRSYVDAPCIVIEISDNGLGIDLKNQRDKVFGLYKRFHPGIEGKGMGLYLVKTQAESLGGKVEVESEADEGTTFRIFFPMH